MENLNPTTGLIGDPIKTSANTGSFEEMVFGVKGDRPFMPVSEIGQASSPELLESNVPKSVFEIKTSLGAKYGELPAWFNMSDATEQRALAQSFGQKIANGVLKYIPKVVIGTSQGLANAIYGTASVFTTGKFSSFYNNELNHTFNKWEKDLQESMPHLYTKAQEKNLFGGAGNFIGGSIMDAMAFTSIAVSTAALGGLGVAGMLARFGTVASRVAALNRTAKVSDILKGMVRGARLKSAKDTEGLVRNLILGAGYESSIETAHMMEQAKQSYISDYQATNGKMPTAGEVAEFDKNLLPAANGLFMLNMAVVGLGNTVTIPQIFGKGVLRNAGARHVKSEITEDTGKRLFYNALAKSPKYQKYLRNTYLVGKPILTEGLWEEGMQGVGSNTALDYISAKYNPSNIDKNADLVSSVLHGFEEQYSTIEGWREMLVGMIVGGLGSVNPTGKGSSLGGFWSGGVMESLQEAKAKMENIDKLVEFAQTSLELYTAGVRDAGYAAGRDVAHNKNDSFDYKNDEYTAFFNYVNSRIHAGQFDLISEEMVEYVNEMTPEEFKRIFDYSADMGIEDVFKRKADVVDKFVKRAETIKKAVTLARQYTDNTDVADGMAHNLASAYNLDERFDSLMNDLNEATNGLDLRPLEAIMASSIPLEEKLKTIRQVEDELNSPEFEKKLDNSAPLDDIVKAAIGEKYNKILKSYDKLMAKVGKKRSKSRSENRGNMLANLKKQLADLKAQENTQENAKYTSGLIQEYENLIKELESALKEEYASRRTGKVSELYKDNFEQFTEDFTTYLEYKANTLEELYFSNKHDKSASEVLTKFKDLERIANRKEDLIEQYNKLQTEKGQQDFLELVQEVKDLMVDDYDKNIFTQLRNKILENPSEFEKGQDYQLFEYAQLGSAVSGGITKADKAIKTKAEEDKKAAEIEEEEDTPDDPDAPGDNSFPLKNAFKSAIKAVKDKFKRQSPDDISTYSGTKSSLISKIKADIKGIEAIKQAILDFEDTNSESLSMLEAEALEEINALIRKEMNNAEALELRLNDNLEAAEAITKATEDIDFDTKVQGSFFSSIENIFNLSMDDPTSSIKLATFLRAEIKARGLEYNQENLKQILKEKLNLKVVPYARDKAGVLEDSVNNEDIEFVRALQKGEEYFSLMVYYDDELLGGITSPSQLYYKGEPISSDRLRNDPGYAIQVLSALDNNFVIQNKMTKREGTKEVTDMSKILEKAHQLADLADMANRALEESWDGKNAAEAGLSIEPNAKGLTIGYRRLLDKEKINLSEFLQSPQNKEIATHVINGQNYYIAFHRTKDSKLPYISFYGVHDLDGNIVWKDLRALKATSPKDFAEINNKILKANDKFTGESLNLLIDTKETNPTYTHLGISAPITRTEQLSTDEDVAKQVLENITSVISNELMDKFEAAQEFPLNQDTADKFDLHGNLLESNSPDTASSVFIASDRKGLRISIRYNPRFSKVYVNAYDASTKQGENFSAFYLIFKDGQPMVFNAAAKDVGAFGSTISLMSKEAFEKGTYKTWAELEEAKLAEFERNYKKKGKLIPLGIGEVNALVLSKFFRATEKHADGKLFEQMEAKIGVPIKATGIANTFAYNSKNESQEYPEMNSMQPVASVFTNINFKLDSTRNAESAQETIPDVVSNIENTPEVEATPEVKDDIERRRRLDRDIQDYSKEEDANENELFEGKYYTPEGDFEWVLGSTLEEVQSKIEAKYEAELKVLESGSTEATTEPVIESTVAPVVSLEALEASQSMISAITALSKRASARAETILAESKEILSRELGITLPESNEELLALATETIKKGTADANESDIGFKVSELPARDLIDYEEAVKNLRRILPDSITIDEIKTLALNLKIKGDVWGLFKDSAIYLNSELAEKGTEYHEAFHAVFRLLLTDEQITAYLKEAAIKYGKPKKADLVSLREVYPEASSGELVRLFYEEKMADEFMEYALKKKAPKESWLKKLFNKIKEILENILSNTDPVEGLFRSIYAGKFKKASTKYNIYSMKSASVYKVIKRKEIKILTDQGTYKTITNNYTTNQSKILYNTIALKIKESENALTEEILEKVISELSEEYFAASANTAIKNAAIRKQLREISDSLENLISNPADLVGDVFDEVYKILSKELQTDFSAEEEASNAEEKGEMGGVEEGVEDSASEFNTDEGGKKDSFKKKMDAPTADKLSVRVKSYLASIWADTNLLVVDQKLMRDFISSSPDNLNLRTSVDGKFLYNQLSKIFANAFQEDFLKKARAMGKYIPEVRAFYNKWSADITRELAEATGTTYEINELVNLGLEVLAKSNTYNLMASELNKYKGYSYDLVFDVNSSSRRKFKMYNANQKNVAASIVDNWKKDWDILNAENDPDLKKQYRNILAEAAVIMSDFTLKYEQEKLNGDVDKLLALSAEAIHNALYNGARISLPMGHIEYSLLKSVQEAAKSHLAHNEILQGFTGETITVLDQNIIMGLENAMSKGNMYSNINKEGEEDNSVGAVSRLRKLAEASSVFDRSVIPNTYMNMNGDLVNDIVFKNYNTSRTLEFQKETVKEFMIDLFTTENFESNIDSLLEKMYEAFPRKFVSDSEAKSWLVALKNNPMINSTIVRIKTYKKGEAPLEQVVKAAIELIFNEDFRVDFVGGVRQGKLDTDEDNSLKETFFGKNSQNEGKPYSEADAAAKIIFLMGIFDPNTQGAPTVTENTETGVQFLKTHYKPHTPGDASYVPIIKMPTVEHNDVSIRAQAKMVLKSELDNIALVNSEVARLFSGINSEVPLSESDVISLVSDMSRGYHYLEKNNIMYFSWMEQGVRKFGSLNKGSIASLKIINEEKYSKVNKDELPRGLKLFEFTELKESEDGEVMDDDLVENWLNANDETEKRAVLATAVNALKYKLDNKFESFIDLLEEYSIVQRNNNKLINGKPLISSLVLPNTFAGEKNEEFNAFDYTYGIKQFYFNDLFNSWSYNTLLYGTPSRTAKNEGDFVKRIKRAIGAGTSFGSGKTSMIILSDAMSNTIFNNTNSAALINRADAQSFSHILWHFNKILRNAKGLDTKISYYKKKEFVTVDIRQLYSKLHRGERLSQKESISLIENNAAHQPNKTLGAGLSTYFKTSVSNFTRESTSKRLKISKPEQEEFNRLYDEVEELIFNNPEFTGEPNSSVSIRIKELYSEIHKYWEAIPGMEAAHNLINLQELNSHAIVAFESAIKTDIGKVHSYNDTMSEVYFLKEENGNVISASVIFDQDLMEIVSTDGYKIKAPDGIQKQQLVYSEQSDTDKEGNAVNISFGDKKIPPSVAASLHRQLTAKRMNVGYEELIRVLNDVDVQGELIKEFGYKNIMKMFQKSLETSSTDPHTKAFFETDIYGNPLYPLNHPTIEPKMQSMLLAAISKNVLSHKISGSKFTLQSDIFTRVLRDENGKVIPRGEIIRNNSKYKIYTAEDASELKFATLDNSDGNYYSEMIVSEAYLSQYGYTYEDFLAGTVPEKLLTFHGVRIPTQDKHSMINTRIVDFVPMSHGNVVIVPAHIVELSGADFDVDALFTHGYAAYKKGRLYGDYLKSDTPLKAAKSEFVAANKKMTKGLLDKYLNSEEFAKKVADNTLAYSENRLSDINPLTSDEASNMLLELTMGLTYNNGNIDIAETPASLSAYKDGINKKYYKSGLFKNTQAFGGTVGAESKARAEIAVATGEKNIGVAAVYNTLHQLLVRQKVIIAKGAFAGRQFSFRATNGERINDSISTMLSAATDNVKELIAALWNLDSKTMSAALNLIGLGVPFETVHLLIKSPIIVAASKNTISSALPILKNKGMSLKAAIEEQIDLKKLGFEEGTLDIFNDEGNVEEANTLLATYIRQSEGSTNELSVEKYAAIEGFVANIMWNSAKLGETLFHGSRIMSLIKGMNESFETMASVENSLNEIGYEMTSTGTIVPVPHKLNRLPIDLKPVLEDPLIKQELLSYFNLSYRVGPNYVLSVTPLFKEISKEVLYQFRSASIQFMEIPKLVKTSFLSFLAVKAIRNTVPAFKDFDLQSISSNVEEVTLDHFNKLQRDLLTLRSLPQFRDNLFLRSFLKINNIVYYDPKKAQAHLNNSMYGKILHLVEGNTRNIKDETYLQELMEGFNHIVSIGTDLKYMENGIEKTISPLEVARNLIGYLMVKDGFLFKNKSFIKQISPSILSNVMQSIMKIEIAFKENNPTKLKNLIGDTMNNTIQDFLYRFVSSKEMAYNLQGLENNAIRDINSLTAEKSDREAMEAELYSFKPVEGELIGANIVSKSGKIVDSRTVDGGLVVDIDIFARGKENAAKASYLLSSALNLDRIEETIRGKKVKSAKLPLYFKKSVKRMRNETEYYEDVYLELSEATVPVLYKGKTYYVVVDNKGVIIDAPKTVTSFIGNNYKGDLFVGGMPAIKATYREYNPINSKQVSLMGLSKENVEELRTVKEAISKNKVKVGNEGIDPYDDKAPIKDNSKMSANEAAERSRKNTEAMVNSIKKEASSKSSSALDLMTRVAKNMAEAAKAKNKTSTNVKPGVSELFESNPKLANEVYEAMGFDVDLSITTTKQFNPDIPEADTYALRINNKYAGLVAVDDNGTINSSIGQTGVELEPEFKGKGYGKKIYLKIAQELLKEGKTLKSELFGKDSINEDATRVWKSLVRDGYAIDRGKYYEIVNITTPQQKLEAQQAYSNYLDTIFPDSKMRDIVYHIGSIGKNSKFDRLKIGPYSKLDMFYFSSSDSIFHIKTELDYLKYWALYGTTSKILSNLILKANTKEEVIKIARDNIKSRNLEANIKQGLNQGTAPWLSYENMKDSMYGWGDYSAKSKDVIRAILDVRNPIVENTKNAYVENPNRGVENVGKYPASSYITNKKYDSYLISNDDIGVKNPEQIHILGSKQDIQGFKESVGGNVKSGFEQSSNLPTSNETINIYAGTKENAELSNFAIRPFEYNTKIFPRETITFQSVEQAFQFMKLEYSLISVQNESIANKILETTNGKILKELGKSFHMVRDGSWDRNSSRIMKELLLQSFKQNPKALQTLLDTGNAVLTHTQGKRNWKKEFPRLLMEVRDILREEGFTGVSESNKVPTGSGKTTSLTDMPGGAIVDYINSEMATAVIKGTDGNAYITFNYNKDNNDYSVTLPIINGEITEPSADSQMHILTKNNKLKASSISEAEVVDYNFDNFDTIEEIVDFLQRTYCIK